MAKTPRTKKKLSPTSLLHYVKLVVRSAFFLIALVLYIVGRVKGGADPFLGYEDIPWLLGLIGLVYGVEMAIRFFPARLESMGCQKQFARNYRPTGETKPRLVSPWRTALVAVVWLGLNGIIGLLYFLGVLDTGILVLISLFYGVCDMICILFFCPFQTWMLKNRCCGDCRIYNWDFAMMFTPFLFVKHWYTWSLLGLSLILLLRWEITYRVRPERFSETTNAALSCAMCEEKLCHHKRQLRSFLKKQAKRLGLKKEDNES